MVDRAPGASGAWLSIVGIGEDGLDGLGRSARLAIREAEIVFGGARHLDLARTGIAGEARAWPSPFDPAMAAVLAERGRKVCVLASGDPFLHGVGATLARRVPAQEFVAHPAPSAFSLAAARLGWPLAEIETISLHGQPVARLRPLLHPGARIVALTSDGEGPAGIGRLMTALGFGGSRIHVLEAMGGPREARHDMRADALEDHRFDALNVVAIEVDAAVEARILPLGGALADDMFEHDGQITKSDIRAMALGALAPRRGELLWDIGAGSGSVAISWMLTHPSLRAIAIEAKPERADRIRRNATTLGAPSLRVIDGAVPGALAGLDAPDAVFVGGGGSGEGVMEAAMAALRPGGRLVAHAVTLEMEAVLLALYGSAGGALTRIALAQASGVGGMTGWRPAMPVTRWVWEKPR